MDLFENSLIDLADKKYRPDIKSDAAVKAKRLGLTYLGFGRYGIKNKEGKIHVTHLVKKNVLYPVMDWTTEKNKEIGAEGVKFVPKVKSVPKEFGDWKTKYGKRLEKDSLNSKKNSMNIPGGAAFVDSEEMHGHVDNKLIKTGTKISKYNLKKYMSDGIQKEKGVAAILKAMAETTDDINKHLYTGKDPNRYNQRMVSWKLRRMDALFQNPMFKSEFDYSVYTGTGANIKTGKTYNFKGFLSTSANTLTASNFVTDKKDRKKTMIQIDIKKGQPIIDINAAFEAIKEQNKFDMEMEHLLPRNTQLKILEGPLHMDDIEYYRAEIVSEHESDEE